MIDANGIQVPDAAPEPVTGLGKSVPGRVGDWMLTAGGRRFWPLDPKAEEVHAEDIAHALSFQCRFAGHCKDFYSVAQHSVLVSDIVPQEDALWALLHDAAEAYCVDVPRPLKRYLSGYADIEAAVMAAVCDKFGLPRAMPDSVRVGDDVILATEARDLMGDPKDWTTLPRPLAFNIHCWKPQVAKKRFIARLQELMREVQS